MEGGVEEVAADAAVVAARAVAASGAGGGEDQAVDAALSVGRDVLGEWLLEEVGDPYGPDAGVGFGGVDDVLAIDSAVGALDPEDREIAGKVDVAAAELDEFAEA